MCVTGNVGIQVNGKGCCVAFGEVQVGRAAAPHRERWGANPKSALEGDVINVSGINREARANLPASEL